MLLNAQLAEKKAVLEQPALLEHENRACTFCGQDTARPCGASEYRHCDIYYAQVTKPAFVVPMQ